MATAHKNLSDYNKADLPDASNLSIGLVVSQWNSNITENLFKGAHDTLLDCGVKLENIHRCNVPGSFELVFGAKKMIETSIFDAIIAIGCIIQGETKHFDFVCQGVTSGIMQLNVSSNIPVIFCVLTDNHIQQSIDRSGGKHGNKGSEAAVAAIKMATFA
ncbi:MAG: 6,7-dimethyl-8-ribityllumazine synthase [Flavobacteriales bacterium CG_4_9_14_3_um_filter_40_17]|nr:MAG: 6,7-dimethyl-8-ribityllumazine synthase [Flavobacteriales bacterium CG_4_9_14_3_um_filter_40_17]